MSDARLEGIEDLYEDDITELKARLAKATSFFIGRTDNGARISLERRELRDGVVLWAVSDAGMVLNVRGGWEYEPLPSNRDDEFIARTRFPLEKAFELAEALVGEPS